MKTLVLLLTNHVVGDEFATYLANKFDIEVNEQGELKELQRLHAEMVPDWTTGEAVDFDGRRYTAALSKLFEEHDVVVVKDPRLALVHDAVYMYAQAVPVDHIVAFHLVSEPRAVMEQIVTREPFRDKHSALRIAQLYDTKIREYAAIELTSTNYQNYRKVKSYVDKLEPVPVAVTSNE